MLRKGEKLCSLLRWEEVKVVQQFVRSYYCLCKGPFLACRMVRIWILAMTTRNVLVWGWGRREVMVFFSIQCWWMAQLIWYALFFRELLYECLILLTTHFTFRLKKANYSGITTLGSHKSEWQTWWVYRMG